MNDNGVCRMATQALQVTALSHFERCLANSLVPALKMPDRMTNRNPILRVSKPGRIMINAPTTPKPMAAQRRIFMASPRNKAAPMVKNKGADRPSAAASAMGISASAIYQVDKEATLMNERTTCRRNFSVRRAPMPMRIKSGT